MNKDIEDIKEYIIQKALRNIDENDIVAVQKIVYEFPICYAENYEIADELLMQDLKETNDDAYKLFKWFQFRDDDFKSENIDIEYYIKKYAERGRSDRVFDLLLNTKYAWDVDKLRKENKYLDKILMSKQNIEKNYI